MIPQMGAYLDDELAAIERALVTAEAEATSAQHHATDWQAQAAATNARYYLGVALRRVRALAASEAWYTWLADNGYQRDTR